MYKKIVFIDDVNDIKLFPKDILSNSDTCIFSFTADVHKELDRKNILHNIADNILTKQERFKIFDQSLEFINNFKSHSNSLKFDGIDLIQLLDTHEILSYIVPTLLKHVIIERILKQNAPVEIIVSSLLENIVTPIIKNSKIKLSLFETSKKEELLWDNITIKHNFLGLPINFTVSKHRYQQIKKLAESTIGIFDNICFDKNSINQKSILLLEFNPELWENLLYNLKNYDGNIILVNRRRPAAWSKKSLDMIKKSNVKVLNFNSFLNQIEISKISTYTNEYEKKIVDCWNDNKLIFNSFILKNPNFWDVISETLLTIFRSKLYEFIFMILTAKKLFSKINLRCIVSLHELGETEKIFLNCNNFHSPSLVLDHGFVERVEETKRFDKLLYVSFKDQIGLWGNIRKDFLINEYGLPENKIKIVGSPRHDTYFNHSSKKHPSKEISVLIAPNPIGEFSGLQSTDLELKFEKLLNDLISNLKELNIKIVVKLHQIQLKHNHEIKNIIAKIDKNIPIHITGSVLEIISDSDCVIVLSSESFGTSTMLMESMILGKPTMNIILDDEIPQYTHVKDNAVYAVSYDRFLRNYLEKFFFDKDFQNNLTKNATTFLEKFISYRGNSSEKCASLLKSF